jgi:hypothetical protein
MKKIILIVLLVCIMLAALNGCARPAYQLYHDDEKGYYLDVDGVIYRSLPEVPWEPITYDLQQIGTIIGTDGENDKYYKLCSFKGDVNQIFLRGIYDKIPFYDENIASEYYYRRDDVEMPPFDSSGIDVIRIEHWGNRSINKIVQEPEVIAEVIDVLNGDEKYNIVYSDEAQHLYKMYFMNSQYEGIAIYTSIVADKGIYWISDGEYYDYPIPQSLLEEITGEMLPTASK